MSISNEIYRRWLKSAYQYYWTSDVPIMSDTEWDYYARLLNPDEHDELKNTHYVPGQSLYWLPPHKYPEWCK
jgi:hypothetical protein